MSNKDTKGYGPRDYALTDTYIEQEVNGIRQRVHMCISFERVHAPKFYIGGRSTALIEKAEHEAAMEEARKEMTLSGERISSLEAALSAKDAEIAELRLSKEIAEKAMKVANERIKELQSQIFVGEKAVNEFLRKDIATLEARVKELQDYAQKAEDKICTLEDQLKSERKKQEEFYEKAKGFEELSDTLRSQLVAAEEKLETYGVRVAERVLQMLNAHGYGGTSVYKEVLAALEKKRAAPTKPDRGAGKEKA